jgi:hypothetical protein
VGHVQREVRVRVLRFGACTRDMTAGAQYESRSTEQSRAESRATDALCVFLPAYILTLL